MHDFISIMILIWIVCIICDIVGLIKKMIIQAIDDD